MKKLVIITLSSEIGQDILTRNSIKNIFRKINSAKEEEFKIDFNKINFISRSCADEYLKQKRETYKLISEINKNLDVKKMFQIVSRPTNNTYFSSKKNDQILII